MDLIVLGNLYENNPQGGRVYSPEGKSACLNGEAGGLGGKSGLYAVCGASRGRGEGYKQELEVRNDEKTNTLTSAQKDNLIISNRIRRLTPTECERLQTCPDNSTLWGAVPFCRVNQKKYAKLILRGDAYIKGDYIFVKMKDTPRYKLLGNGWTRDAVAFFFTFMDSARVSAIKGSQLQSTLFDLM